MVSRRTFLGVLAGGLGMTLTGGAMAASAGRSAYWLPDEAQPHHRTFMQWPVNRTVHPDALFLDDLQGIIAEIANTIVDFEPVVMLMDAMFIKKARRRLADRVEIWPVPTDDLWCRDSGPLFVRNSDGDLAVADLNFNGWGGKQVHGHDAEIPHRVAARLGLAVRDSGIVGEPGGVESDGHGTLLAHESSWVNANRNTLTRTQISARLRAALGGQKIIWAPGIAGADITDYHIDALARYSAPGQIVIQLPDRVDPDDPWSQAAFETHDILAAARDARGRRLHLRVIPEPVDVRVTSSEFVASYVNYYVCNGAVIAHQFGDQVADAEAARGLAAAYPNREIVMINADALGEIGGGIHCATQQQPAV